MMTHDPYQNYQTPGAFAGASPYGTPYAAFQPTFNPIGIAGALQAHPGFGGYGIYPNPLQSVGPLQQILALNSLLGTLQNPFLQQQQAQTPWYNPLLTAALQNPQMGNQNWPQQQQQPNYPLAPQSLIGAGGIGQSFAQQFGYPVGQIPGQIHPLTQLALRQSPGYGFSPLTGCF